MSGKVAEQLEELRQDAKLSKDRHFSAASRKLRYHLLYGVPVIIFNIFMATVLVYFLAKSPADQLLNVTAIGVAFAAATLSGIQTFFNFHKTAEGHRSIANRYLEVSHKCKRVLGQFADSQISLTDLWAELYEIEDTYHKINRDAEAFPTSNGDFRRAKERQLMPSGQKELSGSHRSEGVVPG